MVAEATRLSLAHWRRMVAELYAQVRQAPAAEQEATALHFRQQRDCLFQTHPQTPLTSDQLGPFNGLGYFPYDSAWRLVGELQLLQEGESFQVQLPEGVVSYTRIAYIHFTAAGSAATLSLYWIEGYGGGLFLPFKDTTNGSETYGGGRYLYDTIKGADLGADDQEIVLDFNYAYNPSCAYNSRWICPLSPPENRLPFPVTAGEKRYNYE